MKTNLFLVAVAASLTAFAAPVWADSEKAVDIKRRRHLTRMSPCTPVTTRSGITNASILPKLGRHSRKSKSASGCWISSPAACRKISWPRPDRNFKN